MITLDKPKVKNITEYVQWVAWAYQGKKKVPINPHTLNPAKTNDPSTWSTYEHASQVAGEHSGVGFVFHSNDPFTGVDLDHCVDPQTGEISLWASEIVEQLDSYTEVSPSGTGMKIWVRGEKPGTKCRTGNVEVYDQERFFTFTGNVVRDVEVADRQHELNQLYKNLFPDVDKPQPQANPSGQDEHLLAVARNERGGEFARLYDAGDTSKYGSASSADYRLCVKLVFYFGDDPERIERLFSGSALASRKKWARADYRSGTITAAIRSTSARYTPKPEPQNDVSSLRESARDRVWSGRGGPVDRIVYAGVLNTVAVYGSKQSDGYTVAVSTRILAEESSCGVASVSRSLNRLESAGLIKEIKPAEGNNAATYAVYQGVPHNAQSGSYKPITTPVFNMIRLAQLVDHLRNTQLERKVTAKDLRSGRKVVSTHHSPYEVKCIGKLAGDVLLRLVELGGENVALKNLAKSMGRRSNDLKTRQIPTLVDAGVITCGDDGLITVVEDVEDRLEAHLKDSGCYQIAQLQRQRHEREREAYRTRNERKADAAPTAEQMAAEKKTREVVEEAEMRIREEYAQAQGTIDELEKHNEFFDTFEPTNTNQLLLPPKAVDGIYYHDALCECWICE